MPVNPAQWTADQAVSANKLNTDLYTFVPGNAFTPNGILFHARRPILSEFVVGAEASSVPYSPTSSFASWRRTPDSGASSLR